MSKWNIGTDDDIKENDRNNDVLENYETQMQ